jgi:hypothetical protein
MARSIFGGESVPLSGRGLPLSDIDQLAAGATAQREIEKAAVDAKGQFSGTTLLANAVVTFGGIDLKFESTAITN